MKTTSRVLASLAVFASILVAGATPVAAASLPPSEWVKGPSQRVVLITFDGQAKADHLRNVLETLESRSAPASFFISGRWTEYHQDKVRAIRRAGHALGNRGYGTEPFTSLSDDELRASIIRAQQELAEVGAATAPYLRAPNGQRDLRVLRIAGSLGYRSVRWTYRAGGGLPATVQKKVVRNARSGSIISLDPWRKSHRKALAGIIDGVRRRGFELRTINALSNAHPIRWDVTLKAGSEGPEVSYLDKTLNAITYPAGTKDKEFDYRTLQAVYAFEKVHGMTRDGVVTPAQMTQIALSERPRTPKREPRNFIEVDVSRQVLFEVRDRRVVHTLPVSTGNEEYYEVDGETYKAHTPRGNFKIERKIRGERVSRLGTLYDPSYFIGGYAFHGSPSVPTYPASHGCVRIPMYQSLPFHDRNPIGTYVFIHD